LGECSENRQLPSSDLWDLRQLNRLRRSLARGTLVYRPMPSELAFHHSSIGFDVESDKEPVHLTLEPALCMIPTFVVGGGGPNLTPFSATRYDETCSKRTSSKIAVTSLFNYRGPCFSYRNCDLQVSTETMPPVPFRLVIITLPFFPISATGYPMSFFPSTSLNPEKFHPQT
jgi:hypothetical protein